MYLADVHRRLIDLARQKVRNGEISERRLAQLCSLSQPHFHNVLNKIRTLSNDSADRLMQALGVTVVDVLWPAYGDHNPEIRSVPVVRKRIGPGIDAELTLFRGLMPVPAGLLTDLVAPLMIRLSADAMLPCTLAANDLVLLDRNAEVRSEIRGRGPWLVRTEEGLRIRSVRLSCGCLYFGAEGTPGSLTKWHPMSPGDGGILDLVLGRVVWLGRQTGDSAQGGYALLPAASSS